jgi:peptidoglycan hydrolase CwlO-like protein
MKKIFIAVLPILAIFFIHSNVIAQTQSPTPSPANTTQVADLQNKINDLQKKISDLRGQEKTLSSQISVMDNQINLTQLKIESTQKQISDLTLDIDTADKKIDKLENSLDKLSRILINRIKATYVVGTTSNFQVLISSSNISDFVTRANYLRIAQEHDKRLIYDTVQARNDYTNQKEIFKDKKSKTLLLQDDLKKYSSELEGEKTAKASLLAQTQGSEGNYQKLLSEAQAQLSGFSRFATSQGGASILPPQDSPDGWYYNQRDERWGNNGIGASGEPVWKYGCLISSVAMVLKQKGEDVNPASIAGNTGNFFSNTAYMLVPWVGGRFTSIWRNDQGAIDSLLSSGKPVIVGLNAGPYGTHFIVLKSGSGGNYTMNDPWHGANLPFTSHYSTGQIFQYGYLN